MNQSFALSARNLMGPEPRDAGFQEEKFEDLYLEMRYSDRDLRNVIDSRIAFAVQRKYARQDRIGFFDVMPDKILEENSLTYMLDRTHKKPRDIIQFVNKVFGQAAGTQEITQKIILDAESKYSEQRLNAIYDEWIDNDPMLRQCTKILAGKPVRFRVIEFSFPDVQDLILQIAMSGEASHHALIREAQIAVERGNAATVEDFKNFLKVLISIFYRVGLVGIKLGSQGTPQWSHTSETRITPESIQLDDLIYVHPMFLRALRINPVEH